MILQVVCGSDRTAVRHRSRAILAAWNPSPLDLVEHRLQESANWAADVAPLFDSSLAGSRLTCWLIADSFCAESKIEKFWSTLATCEGRVLLTVFTDTIPKLPDGVVAEVLSQPANHLDWIIKQASAVGKTIGLDAARALASRCEESFSLLESETAKLISYCGNDPHVSIEMVEAVISPSGELAVWDWIDATVAGKIEVSSHALAELLGSGHAPAALYSALSLKVAQIHQARSWLDQPTASRGDLAAILSTGRTRKPMPPFAMERLLETARSQSLRFWDRFLVDTLGLSGHIPTAATLRELSLKLSLVRPRARRTGAWKETLMGMIPPSLFEVLWREKSGYWRRRALQEPDAVRDAVGAQVGSADAVLVRYQGALYRCLPATEGYRRTPLPAHEAAWLSEA
jgi:hypothetical protein